MNHRVAGFDNVDDYVASTLVSEGAHLDAFVGFVIGNHLDDELRDKRWADFACGYNGRGYKQNRYDERMAQAYAEFAAGHAFPTTLEIQGALNRHGAHLVVDGITGPATRGAIREFQRAHGLPITGIAGPETLAALGLAESHDPIEESATING